MNYYKKFENYLKEYENRQSDLEFFKSEINSVIAYIYFEIEFSKEYIRFKDNGIETDYQTDIEKFEKNITKFKRAFIGDNIRIKKPMKLSELYATSFNYFTHLGLKKDIINSIFEIIREDTFELKTSPKLGKAQKQLSDEFINIIDSCNKIVEDWKIFVQKNPELTFEQLKIQFSKRK